VARRSGEKTGWQPRTAGAVICAFFVLGVMTGFSATGHQITMRAVSSVREFTDSIAVTMHPASDAMMRSSVAIRDRLRDSKFFEAAIRLLGRAPIVKLTATGTPPIAMVRRGNDFYALAEDGELTGPIDPRTQVDLPVLSGAVDDASRVQMIAYADALVRAETILSQLISEMRVHDDGTATLCLERERTELTIDLDNVPHELARSSEVMKQLSGREQMVAALDMTMPDEAIVRLRDGASLIAKKPQVIASAAIAHKAGRH
jgi:Cell division protein FtsQ